MRYDAIFFDLDGTLLDTLQDICDSMNATLALLGHPSHPLDAYRRFVGDGIETLASRSLPPNHRTSREVEACVAGMRKEYGANWNNKTRPYSGIPETLARLGEAGVTMAVLSNKPDDFTRFTVEEYFPGGLFRAAVGIGPETPPKPDPTGALHLVESLALAPSKTLFVGDTDMDMATALGAGMVPIGVSWGFRPAEEILAAGARRIVDHPGELLDLVGLSS